MFEQLTIVDLYTCCLLCCAPRLVCSARVASLRKLTTENVLSMTTCQGRCSCTRQCQSSFLLWAHSSGVERALCMREVQGSRPCVSIFCCNCLFVSAAAMQALWLFCCYLLHVHSTQIGECIPNGYKLPDVSVSYNFQRH